MSVISGFLHSDWSADVDANFAPLLGFLTDMGSIFVPLLELTLWQPSVFVKISPFTFVVLAPFPLL